MLKTAECVSPRHPDKMCDRISDAVLDAYLSQDPKSRVAIEAVGSHGQVWVTGEVTTRAIDIDIPAIVRSIAGDDLEIRTHVVAQSPEIAKGVDVGGAGDQGSYSDEDGQDDDYDDYNSGRDATESLSRKIKQCDG